MTLNEVKVRRDLLMESIMGNEHLSKIFYDGQQGLPKESECIKKLKLLNQAVETESSNDCGCGKNMRLNTLENLLHETEAIWKELQC